MQLLVGAEKFNRNHVIVHIVATIYRSVRNSTITLRAGETVSPASFSVMRDMKESFSSESSKEMF